MIASNTDAKVIVDLSLELWIMFKLWRCWDMDISGMGNIRPRDTEMQFPYEQSREWAMRWAIEVGGRLQIL